MTQHIKQFLFSIAFLLYGVMGFAQVYPVQISTVFNTPYSSRISDYATSMDVKMQLLINPTDITINNRQVRLKIYIQGSGINAQSSDFVTGMSPIYINGGELLSLTNLDIAPLFKLENLQGLSAVQYANPLPEGLYSVCFEMYDFITNQHLSQKSCANLYLMLNDPPLLNLPARNEQIAVTEFPNILFTWTPRQMNATNVSYQFELKEIQDPTINPQIGFLISPILYEETLYSTALVYDLSKPNLIPNKKYAWRVRAMSTSGLSLNSVFKNDGYSEIYHFTYASNCIAPSFLLSEAVSSRSVRLSWLGDASHTKYHVQYRKKDVPNAEWFEVYTMNTQATISDLEAGINYEFRVGASCDAAVMGSFAFTYSGINSFNMPTQSTGVSNFTCGINPGVAISNQTPLTNLIVSESFTAGDFPVKVLELQGQNPYSGKGYIVVPYLADTKIAVIFNNITINTNYQLINGLVETSYNPQAPNISDVEDLTAGANGTQITQTVTFVIVNITTNSNGDIIVSGPNGEQITIPGGSNLVITGADGQVYTVDSNGNPTGPFSPAPGGATTPQNTEGVAQNGLATQFTAQGISVAFEATTETKYSWDTLPVNAPSYIAEKYAKVGSQTLGYKAVVNRQTDVLKAKVTLTDSSIVLDSLVFKTHNGVLIERVKQGNDFILQLKGSQTYAEEEIQAVIKQGNKYKVAGAFKLVHLSEKEITLVLVPLNNTSSIPDNTQANIQSIYAKAGVKVNITQAPVLTYDGAGDNKITTGDSDILEHYTEEEQTINAQIKALSGYNNKAYYLIYSNLPSDKGIEGFMAVNGQFGYAFPNADNKTAAHELGHGALSLSHPFANAGDKGKTPFLMDYGTGTELSHLDWQQINNPNLKLYWFQEDSQGEFVGYRLTPDWKPFSFTGSKTYISGAVQQPNGAVYGIEYNDKNYIAVLENGKYTYKNGENVLPNLVVLETLADDKDVILFWDRGVCGYSETYTAKWGYIKDKKGFNIDDVTEPGKIVFKERVPCSVNGMSQGNSTANSECDSKDIALLNTQKNALISVLNNPDAEIVTSKINEVDICAIRKLTYSQIETLIVKISSLSDIDNQHEKALLRLMNCIKEENYVSFFDLLENDTNKISKHFVDEFNDHSINPFDGDNYTSLNILLLQMYQANPKGWINRIPAGDLPTYFLDKYFTKPNVKIASLKDLITGTSEIYEQGFQYNPNNGTIRITHTATSIQAIAGNSTGAYYAPIGMPRIISSLEVSPLSPVVIDFNDDLPVIELALQNSGYQKGQEIIIPAVFLKYGLDKLNANLTKKSSLLVLNGLTIMTGVPAAVQAASLAKRIWALAEVTGAVGDIAANTNYVETNYPKLKGGIDAFNGGMGLIGFKNLVTNTGVRNLFTNLPQQIKQAYLESREIKALIAAKYIDWQIATQNLDNLSVAERQIIAEQEKVWKALNIGNLGSHLTGILKSSYDDFITKGLSAVADGTTIKFLDASGHHLIEIANGKLIYKYAGYGADIIITEGKTTTVLGKFAEQWSNPNSNGTRYFLGSAADPVVTGFPNGIITRGSGVASPNRLNFLDIPEVNYNTLINKNIKAELEAILGTPSSAVILAQSENDIRALITSNHPGITPTQLEDIMRNGINKGKDEFWDTYNLPFLEQAFQRGDDVRLVSDPLIYQPDAALGGTYKRELDAITGSSGFAKKYGYTYNSTTKTYTK